MTGQIIDGELDFADLCYLIALVIFAVEFVLGAFDRALPVVLTPIGFAFIALGLLVT